MVVDFPYNQNGQVRQYFLTRIQMPNSPCGSNTIISTMINPKIIYCSLTGFGQTGPLKDKPGHDINYLAVSGIMSYSGRKETGRDQSSGLSG